jgi:hypothetical protein
MLKIQSGQPTSGDQNRPTRGAGFLAGEPRESFGLGQSHTVQCLVSILGNQEEQNLESSKSEAGERVYHVS